MPTDNWTAGDAYEHYMGRWSRPVARRFVDWLHAPHGMKWLEVGCGTGALSSAICDAADPAALVASDPSAAFLEHAQRSLSDSRVSFVVADAQSLPDTLQNFDFIVSGLALNFVADPVAALTQMGARLRSGGTVGAYVWDYAEGMGFLRVFWDEVIAFDPAAAAHDEGLRFPICRRGALNGVFADAGLSEIASDGLEIPTDFESFDDFWAPFMRGTGPAPAYVMSLSSERREHLKKRLAERMTPDAAGRIRLTARAWAVRGRAA